MSEAKITGFHHIAIKAKDFDKTMALYTDVFGFKLMTKWGGTENPAAMLDIGNGDCLEIFSGRDYEVSEQPAYLHLAFRTNDAKGMFDKAIAAGLEVVEPAKDVTIEGDPLQLPVTIAFCKGLDGEIIEFFQSR